MDKVEIVTQSAAACARADRARLIDKLLHFQGWEATGWAFLDTENTDI